MPEKTSGRKTKQKSRNIREMGSAASRNTRPDGSRSCTTSIAGWLARCMLACRRSLDPLGVFASKKGDKRNLDTFAQKWRYIHPFKRILYMLYIGPLLFMLLFLAIIFYIPWTVFSRCRPKPYEPPETEKSLREREEDDRYDAIKRVHHRGAIRDVCAPLGYGPGWNGKPPTSSWSSFWMRVGDMYALLRDIVLMFSRQGLQVIGVICGGTMALMQIIRIGMELNGGEWSKYVEAKATGAEVDFMKNEADCAYLTGTGFAAWSPGWQKFLWFTLYHGWVLLLCFMLIADEVLNVRMGLLSPQWSRGGNGYTMIFLALCLINGSPNWGWKIMIPVHHIILIAIMICGAYNVIRLILSAMTCTPDREIARENKRSCRLPLRPWTPHQWRDAWLNGSFRRNQNLIHDLHAAQDKLDDLRRLRSSKPNNVPTQLRDDIQKQRKLVDEAQSKWDALYPSERIQALVGDHARELRDKKDKREQELERAVYDENIPLGAPESNRESKDRPEALAERGRTGRAWIHGWTIMPPRFTGEDHYLFAPNIESVYITSTHQDDRFLVYDGDEPLQVNILGKKRWLYPQRGKGQAKDIFQPTYSQWVDGDAAAIPKHFRWESKAEFDGRAARNLKCDEDYSGAHDWKCPTPAENRRWYIWFDIRRGLCISAALLLLCVHSALIFCNMGYGSNNWPAYTAQHEDAVKAWKENGGPSDDTCQYYQGSVIAIWIRPGGQTFKGVFLALFFYAAWELLIICLCLGVMLVAATNNRTYGMHLPVPISLIGPRLSSVSMGWTLSFIAAATLQLGMFHFQSGMQWVARLIAYWGIFVSVLCLVPNEEMRAIVSRNPFMSALSLWAHEWLDKQLVYRRRRDAEYD